MEHEFLGHYFTTPLLLCLALIYAGVVFASRGASLRRRNWSIALHAGAIACLALAAAGLTLPSGTRRLQLLAVADVSDSIYDLNTQSERIRELLEPLKNEVEYGVVVFAETPALEKPIEKLGAEKSAFDLSRLNSIVRRAGTDIGAAIQYARGALSQGSRGAILLLSDFRDTAGSAQGAASALRGGNVELLLSPALLNLPQDVQIVEVRAPERVEAGRSVPVEITVSSRQPVSVRVGLWRQPFGQAASIVKFETVELKSDDGIPGREIRKTVRISDTAIAPGVMVYSARIGETSGDVTLNNSLQTAVRITGPARWAVVTRKGSTLEALARDSLGIEAVVMHPAALPADASAYAGVSGIVLDGLSAEELPPEGAGLRAIESAVNGGKSFVALGGPRAFGAGAHPREGILEQLLPVELTPEDDRTRTVLFLIDISKSMKERAAQRSIRKIDFAGEQLAQAVQRLRTPDRLGLITFSGSARIAAPLSTEPSRSAFLSALKNAELQTSTDIYSALILADAVLKHDDAEEQLIVLISDGVQTIPREREEIIRAARELCPEAKKRRMLYVFGIGTGPGDSNETGEALLKDLARAGGGKFAPDFLTLADRLSQTFEQAKKEFFYRTELFNVVKTPWAHALFSEPSAWPLLDFRNRVKAKPFAETLLLSESNSSAAKSRPDPLLVTSGAEWPGLSRRAALALALDGRSGSALLQSFSGQQLLSRILAWADARLEESRGWRLSVENGMDDKLHVELRASDPSNNRPVSTLAPVATLTQLRVSAAENLSETPAKKFALRADAPGVYRAEIDAPPSSVCRLKIEADGRSIERFVSTPPAAEVRRFGVDRAAMLELAERAGPNARLIESARDMQQWLKDTDNNSGRLPLRPYLLIAALVLLLVEFGARNWIVRKR